MYHIKFIFLEDKARTRKLRYLRIFPLVNRAYAHLVVILLFSRLGGQCPSAVSVLVLLMLERQLAQMTNDILHLGVVDIAVGAAEVVETRNFVEKEVGDSHDDDHADRVGPDNDAGNDIGVTPGGLLEPELGVGVRKRLLELAAGQPAEDSKYSCHSVDGTDGADELPGRECVAPTGDKNEPVLSECDFEEEDFLDTAKILDDTSVGQIHCAADDPGSKSELNSENNGNDPDFGELPFYRTLL